MNRKSGWILVVGMLLTVPLTHAAEETAAASGKPIEADGTVNVPIFQLPPSVYLSESAKTALPRKPQDHGSALESMVKSGAVPKIREGMRKSQTDAITKLASAHKVRIEKGTLGGIPGVWARPENPAKNAKGKVLIDLPGGAFILGDASTTGMLESIPVAGRTGYPVFSVDYRQAPEAVFPAASEDVAAVYRALLKDHKSRDIGLFGTSAGGLLTAQSLAWFQKENLPMPGAVGIFSASADARWAGDSWFWQMPIQGIARGPSLDERFYYAGHDLADPLMSPIESDAVLARFPPTLIVTASRAGELSSAINTHRLLVRNGVKASLNVWDGLGHAFYLMNADLPESHEAFDVMARFFTERLGENMGLPR